MEDLPDVDIRSVLVPQYHLDPIAGLRHHITATRVATSVAFQLYSSQLNIDFHFYFCGKHTSSIQKGSNYWFHKFHSLLAGRSISGWHQKNESTPSNDLNPFYGYVVQIHRSGSADPPDYVFFVLIYCPVRQVAFGRTVTWLLGNLSYVRIMVLSSRLCFSHSL